MPLSRLNPISVRPRGGVTKVELIPASEYAGAVPSSVEWAFREDRAHYSEERVAKTPLSSLSPLVRHTLEMDIPATATGRRRVDELAAVCTGEGVVAVVTMASGETVAVGWSARFGVRYPLRVAINPAISTVGWSLSAIFSAEIITSIVLNLESVGPAFIESVKMQDVYLAGSILLILCTVTIVGTVVSDILLALADPRIRIGGEAK